MPARIEAATAIKLSTTAAVLVAELAAGVNQIVGIAIGNKGTATAKVSIHVINTNQTSPLDVLDQFNAFGGWYLRELGPREETVILTVPLGPGNKVEGLCDLDDTVSVHVFPVIA